ncbi:MAG: hypothetical protein ACXWLG_08160 [Myxococcaceae bacterium]
MAVVAVPADARACSCGGPGTWVWPSELKDVPRAVHILVGNARDPTQYRLEDVGPARRDDPIGKALVSAESRVLPRGGPDIVLPPPGTPVPVDTHQVKGSGFKAFEMLPRSPLGARRRFVIRGPVGQRERELLALFETGERLDVPLASPPALVLEKVTPDREDLTSDCDTGSGDAQFRDNSGRVLPTIVGIWSSDSTAGAPEAFAVVTEGRLTLGRPSKCSTFGLGLYRRNPRSFVIRAWSFGGFGAPATITFEL